MPFPSEETTPPVTKMKRVSPARRGGESGIRRAFRAESRAGT